jgi:hypothetical protein
MPGDREKKEEPTIPTKDDRAETELSVRLDTRQEL